MTAGGWNVGTNDTTVLAEDEVSPGVGSVLLLVTVAVFMIVAGPL